MSRNNNIKQKKDNRKYVRLNDNDAKYLDDLANRECNGNVSSAIELLIYEHRYSVNIKEPHERQLDYLFEAIESRSYTINDTNKKMQMLLMFVIALLENEGITNIEDYLGSDYVKDASKIVSERIEKSKNKLK